MAEPDAVARRIDAAESEGRYRRLPESIRLEDTVATQESGPPPDPNAGRDPETDFTLRYGM